MLYQGSRFGSSKILPMLKFVTIIIFFKIRSTSYNFGYFEKVFLHGVHVKYQGASLKI